MTPSQECSVVTSDMTVGLKQEAQLLQRDCVRCFVSLNILLSHSRSLEVIENGIPIESLRAVSYSHSIANMAVSLAV